MLSLNTHDYDGKLKEAVKIIEERILVVSNIDTSSKLTAFHELQNELAKQPGYKGAACKNLATIISDFKKYGRKGANYDPTNNLYADDLLYICYQVHFKTKDANTDVADIIIAQLSEMSNGMCAQGRTHRLMQIMNALLELE